MRHSPCPRTLAAGLATALALTAPVAPARAQAAAPAEIRIRVDGEKAANAGSGMLTFPRQGLQARVTVVGVDTAGKPVSLARLAPRWSSSDPTVVSTYGNPSSNPIGVGMLVVAQEDGRATLSVTAGGKTASIPVVVGKARQGIAAAELTPKFRVARLEIVAETGNAGPEAEATAAGVRLRENGHGVLLRARAVAADGTPVPLADFPVVWATGDEKIVELYQTDETETQTTSREVGRTTVTASVQGIAATVSVEVLPMGSSVGPMGATQRTVVASAGGGAGIPVTKEEAAGRP